jgi:hypothetical protein
MAKDAPPPLTAEELQDAVRELAKGLMYYGSRVRVLELLVLEKGLATEDELEKAEERVAAQMKRELGAEIRRLSWKGSKKIQ